MDMSPVRAWKHQVETRTSHVVGVETLIDALLGAQYKPESIGFSEIRTRTDSVSAQRSRHDVSRNPTTSVGVNVAAVKELLALFWLERAIYITSIVISLIAVFYFVFQAFRDNTLEQAQMVGIFGPSGIATVTTGRLMKMWNDAVKIIQGSDQE